MIQNDEIFQLGGFVVNTETEHAAERKKKTFTSSSMYLKNIKKKRPAGRLIKIK